MNWVLTHFKCHSKMRHSKVCLMSVLHRSLACLTVDTRFFFYTVQRGKCDFNLSLFSARCSLGSRWLPPPPQLLLHRACNLDKLFAYYYFYHHYSLLHCHSSCIFTCCIYEHKGTATKHCQSFACQTLMNIPLMYLRLFIAFKTRNAYID